MAARKKATGYNMKYWRVPTWWIEGGKRYEQDEYKVTETAEQAEAKAKAEMDVMVRLGWASEVGVEAAVEQPMPKAKDW